MEDNKPVCEHSFGFTDDKGNLRCVACNEKLDEDEWGMKTPDDEIGKVTK